ncbi:MAG: GTP-binding protein [Rectinemataceae bacterium]|jgi:elongation factor G
MNDPRPRSIRDIGILAHIDAGKTSLTERLLFVSGRIRSPGDIDEGTTLTDYLDVERERGITVKAAAANLEWERMPPGPPVALRINLIDTPGHVDFSSEVGRSLRALDGAVVLVCAVAGVQSRTEALYRACARRGVARLAFVNKMDRRGASFDRALGDFVRMLDPGAVAIQIPWGEGEAFHGVVDLVDLKAYDFSAFDAADPVSVGTVPRRPMALPIPHALAGPAARGRAALVEALAAGVAGSAEGDPGLLEDFVAGRESSPEMLRAALRAAVIAGRATPVLCGSAFSDSSAALLLDAVADYLPAPGEAARPEGRDPETGSALTLGPDDPFSGLVFKTLGDPHFGRLSWLRVRSGRVAPGDRVLDVGAGKLVRITRIFGIQADRFEALLDARDGDIVALALGGQGGSDSGASGKVQGAVGATGATLCDPRRPILYEPIGFEEPVVSLALEPRTREDGERLLKGAVALSDEDPSIRLREDPQTGRIELSGMGELHLEVAAERLTRDFGARFRVGKPRVAYREILAAMASAAEAFDRDLGGERARASVRLRLGPGADHRGFSFAVDPSLRVAAVLTEAVRRGAEAALSVGPSAGFPLESARVVLEALGLPGGSVSSPGKVAERAVEIAASLATGRALREAGTVIVEPVMRIELTVSEDFLGVAAAAASGRGGRIESIDVAPGGGRIVSGAAPLRCLFGFAGELRSVTEGRAEYSARFLRYEAVPAGAGIE